VQRDCAFLEHRAEATHCLTEKPGVTALQFECKECCARYVVSDDLLSAPYAVLLKQSGETLSRLAKRLTGNGELLKLITPEEVAQGVSEQTRFEQQQERKP